MHTDYRGILEKEAEKNRVKVYYHSRGAQWGRAALGSKRIFVPNPARFASFFTGLHELGHIMSGHHGGDGKQEYLWEFEAFIWALRFCEQRGIHVPAKTIDNERNIIAEKLKDEAESGAKSLDPKVVGFVKQGGSEDPDVRFIKKVVSDSGKVRLTALEKA